MNINVLYAVFKRNFVNYFLNPTGYVFICLFVELSCVAAICSNEFFNANLANLDQLNTWFPFIMLVFVPAITMSIWAEERNQGTDELLLTIPAGDFEIVLGKYLAAVAIYTVSLLYSLLVTYLILRSLGEPDVGLFLTTYFGYWMLGLAMLAVGMTASFLTRNLTVAYILGALFNAPLVMAMKTDAIPNVSSRAAIVLKQWSFGGQFLEFGRGMINLSSLAYFTLIMVAMLYLSMVLIGRRQWARGGSTPLLGMHFLLRTVALLAVTTGTVYFLFHHDVRLDATSERLSSLSPHTVNLVQQLSDEYAKGKAMKTELAAARDAKDEAKIKEIDAEYQKIEVKSPIRVEAFISPEVPQEYIPTRLNLLSTLRELQARAGGLLDVQVNETPRYGNMADLAKNRYGITARPVDVSRGGARAEDRIFMGLAVTSGTEKVVTEFVDRDTPAEYVLVRSLYTVTQQKRKRLGVLTTDAGLFGGFSMQGPSPKWPVIAELEKQYEVIQVNAAQPIPERKMATKPGEKEEGFDALLAVQPSKMGPEDAKNLIDAIRRGQPTAIFEDPLPMMCGVPATSDMRRPPNEMMQMAMRGPQPQGNLKPLWKLLGVNFATIDEGGDGADATGADDVGDEEMPFSPGSRKPGADQIVWQQYNPYPKFDRFNDQPEFVFIDQACGARHLDWDRLVQTLDRGTFDNFLLLKTLKKLGYEGPIGLQGFGVPGKARDNLKRSFEAWQGFKARMKADGGGELTNDFFALDNGTGRNRFSFDDQAKMLKDLGYQGIGFSGTQQLQEMLKALDTQGSELFSLYVRAQVTPEGYSYDPQLKQALPLLKGRRTLVLLAISGSDLEEERQTVRLVREVAGIADQQGLRVALYPRAGSHLGSVQKAIQIVKNAQLPPAETADEEESDKSPPTVPKCENVGVVFNLCHFLKVDDEKNLDAVLKEAKPYLFAVTINGADSGTTSGPFAEEDLISSHLQQLLFAGPGCLEKRSTSELLDRQFTPLARSGPQSGTVNYRELLIQTPFGTQLNPFPSRQPGLGYEYVLAAHITGRLPASKVAPADPAKPAVAVTSSKDAKVNVVLVADIDMLTTAFFHLRDRGEIPELGIHFRFDNVTFVLNAVDSLADEKRFLELRSRRPKHRSLTRFDASTENARRKAIKAREECRIESEDAIKKESKKLEKDVANLRKQMEKENLGAQEIERQLGIKLKEGQARVDEKKAELEQKRDARVQKSEDRRDEEIQQQRDWQKLRAVLLPPIAPLFLACLVFAMRRTGERQGVSRNRLR